MLTFEEDLEFDPLKRSDSINRSNSFGFSSTGSFSKKPPTPAVAPVLSMQPSNASPTTGSVFQTTSQDTAGLINELSGIDLNPSSINPSSTSSTSSINPSSTTHSLQQRQDGVLQPFQNSSTVLSMNAMIGSSSGVLPYPQGIIQIVPSPSGTMGQGQVPLALQGGVVYGGGAPGMVPVMHTSQGTPGMIYQVGIMVSNLVVWFVPYNSLVI